MNAITPVQFLTHPLTTPGVRDEGRWEAPSPACWMVLYDGSPSADDAVAAGMECARLTGASLFMVAVDLRTEPHDRLDYERALGDDLATFARFAARAGLDVDGTLLSEPTVENLAAIAGSHRVTGVLVTDPFPSGLMGAFVARSGLPRQVVLAHATQGGAA
ncbi:hypothetical protein [Luteibacter sp. CQ10]|uniref:hypothetical protein n=1 Tax=Luteibacter sp. CQ10 TaxID=2805821 RepID=UPI0034A2DB6E